MFIHKKSFIIFNHFFFYKIFKLNYYIILKIHKNSIFIKKKKNFLLCVAKLYAVVWRAKDNFKNIRGWCIFYTHRFPLFMILIGLFCAKTLHIIDDAFIFKIKSHIHCKKFFKQFCRYFTTFLVHTKCY